jgi:hypothetical protein
MKRSIASLGVAVFAFASLFGCSSSSDSGGGSTSVTQACTDIASALCAKYESCVPFYVTLDYGDVATCQSRAVPSCTNYPTAPGSTLTGDQIETCSKSIAAASCSQLLDQGINSLSGCNLVGTLDNGRACASGFQCTSGFCPTAAGTTCGTCAAQTKPGDACVNGSCYGGQSCVVGSSGSGTCQVPAAAGAACTGSCVTGYSCVSGTCTAFLKPGDTCSVTSGPACDLTQGYTCQTNVCATITLPKVGEACGSGTKTGPFCAAHAVCSGGATAAGTCVAPADDGATCDTTKGPGCKPGAECTGGVCKLPDPNTCK